MKANTSNSPARRCIVVVTDERSERITEGVYQPLNAEQAAVVKKGFLRQASLRARRVASPAHVLVSAREEDRSVWMGPLWFTHPANRFISDRGVPASLSTAAAMLSIAAASPSCLVTVMPNDFWVARESVLSEAIENGLSVLEQAPDTVATLGMSDTHPGTAEDYLVVGRGAAPMGAPILAKAHRPGPTVAKQLLEEGALVASGILLGQARAFAARICSYWPQLARELSEGASRIAFPVAEHRLRSDVYRRISRSLVRSMRLFPPTFAMRAFSVRGSGWCSRSRLDDVQPVRGSGPRASRRGLNSAGVDYLS